MKKNILILLFSILFSIPFANLSLAAPKINPEVINFLTKVIPRNESKSVVAVITLNSYF